MAQKTMAPKMGPRMKGIWLESLEFVAELVPLGK